MKKGFTIVEILIYIVILAMFFMAANVGYNSFIARKRTEMVARKVEAMLVKARGLSFSASAKPTGCGTNVIDAYVVEVNAGSARLFVKCGLVDPDEETTLIIENYSYENGIISNATGQEIGYKLLGHGLDTASDFFDTVSNYTVTFNRTGATTNGTILTISQSGEVKITAQ